MIVRFVGGPADGQAIEGDYDHSVATVNVPVPGKGGFGTFQYTLRKCRDASGNPVMIMAPAGRQVDPAYLAKHKIKN